MAQQWQASEEPSSDRSVRCVQIVEHTYRKGSASLDELAKLTGADAATIERDVAALRRGGLRVDIDVEGRCRVNQVVPGFALRLTVMEAASAWVRRWYCSTCRLQTGYSVPPKVMSAACSILESGLRKYHGDSEEVCRLSADCRDLGWEALGRNVDGGSRVKLTGEARRVCKRLRIFDLVESGKARRREQLTALLGTSDRTLGNDLRVLRQAGLRIGYLRSGGTYRVDSMHTHFARELSPPKAMACAAALLVLFGSSEDEEGCEAPRGWAECASRKIVNGIGLIFKKGRQDLDAVMASFGASA